jgi:poly-gamma-glutamate synthesis protein (capsule biosynthesis protein)
VSNFPLAYKLSWLPRLLNPSLAGDRSGFAPPAGTLLEPFPTRTVRLVFVGDISAVANRAAPVVDPEIHDLLGAADLVVGNCESPVVEKVRAPLGTALGIRHAMGERFLVETLEAAGIARDRLVLSVANNHALDQGVEGFDETLAALRRLGIRVVGQAGEPVAKIVVRGAGPEDPFRQRTSTPTPFPHGRGEAAAPEFLSRFSGRARGEGALTVGLVAFTQWRNAAAGAFGERVAMASDMASWPYNKAAQGCDLICALPHWDWEFRHFPCAETRTLARRLADAGAGLIVGGHAHVLQPVGRIGGTLVAYGMGDFLGTALPRQPWPGRIGALLSVDVSLDGDTRGRIAAYRLHPFFRLREGWREHLVPVGMLAGRLRGRVAGRLAALGAGDAVA